MFIDCSQHFKYVCLYKQDGHKSFGHEYLYGHLHYIVMYIHQFHDSLSSNCT